ncbi:MAG: Rieske (2Fe-2S) domain-containing protein, partial [Bacteroidetes bacterium]
MKNELFVDPDIKKAHTLPSDFYTGERFFEESKNKIFARSWQLVADRDDLRIPGRLFPHNLLHGFLDEPLLLARDKEDQLHCLSNVCTHRGNLLVEAACTEQHIRCRYHGRRFKLNGEFHFMPEFEGVENFPSEKDHLAKIPFANWDPFVFASLRPADDFGNFFGDMQKRAGWLPVSEHKLQPVRSRDYLVKAHWALYCENYLEGFHIPYVHQSLNTLIDYGSYSTELFRYSSLQLARSRGGEEIFSPPAGSPDHGKAIAAYYWWVFPNLMFNFYPWGISVNVVRPLAPDLTKVSFITYVYDESKLDRGAGGDLDKVERED